MIEQSIHFNPPSFHPMETSFSQSAVVGNYESTSTRMIEQLSWFPSESNSTNVWNGFQNDDSQSSLMQKDDTVPNKRRKLSNDHDECK